MGDLVRYPRVLAVAAVASVAGVCLPTGPVTAAPVVSAGQTASAVAAARQLAASDRSLREASDRPVSITRDPDGRVRAVVADPTHPLQRASTVGNATPPADAAKAFLAEHADALGLATNAQGLKALRTDNGTAGDRIVRFSQEVQGVPVVAATVIVVTQADGDVLSIASETTPTTTAAKPVISQQIAA
jgi:Zn-dependent metalloprotease